MCRNVSGERTNNNTTVKYGRPFLFTVFFFAFLIRVIVFIICFDRGKKIARVTAA